MDLDLLGGAFLKCWLPRDKQFLAKYFPTPTEKLFLSYYLHFGKISEEYNVRILYQNFIDHTGYYCSEQWFHFLLKRITAVLSSLKKAEQSMDLNEVEKIKTGKYKNVKRYNKSMG